MRVPVEYMTIHRYVPASAKRGESTACGIPLTLTEERPEPWLAEAEDGGDVRLSRVGRPFDCRRCRHCLESRHESTRKTEGLL